MALLGDAGHRATPLTGLGTSLPLVGAAGHASAGRLGIGLRDLSMRSMTRRPTR